MKFAHSSAFSFGKDTKGKLERTDRLTTPGPGTYTPAIKRGSPGTELRSKSSGRHDIPGPGQYELKTTVGKSGPKYTMSSKSGNVDMSKYVVSPGPGIYTPKYNAMYKSFSYSMSSRPNSAKTYMTPGPGNYNVRVDKSMQVPSYKFGSEKRDPLASSHSKFIPGPGNYNTVEQVGKGAPKFSFGKEMRADRGRPMTPGPGQYNYKTFIGKDTPKISMSYRPQTSAGERSMVPGPGQYNMVLSNRTKSPSYRIGSAKRDSAPKHLEAMPGPGQYTPAPNLPTRPKSPTWSMGTGTRTQLNPTEMVPGPGNYNVRRGPSEGPKFSMTGKGFYNANKTAIVPGPGQYNQESSLLFYKSPTWRIGTSSRDDNIKKAIRENLPGPGNYSLKTERSTPSFRFGTGKRVEERKNDTPGPGQYRIPNTICDVASYSRTGGFEASYKFI